MRWRRTDKFFELHSLGHSIESYRFYMNSCLTGLSVHFSRALRWTLERTILHIHPKASPPWLNVDPGLVGSIDPGL